MSEEVKHESTYDQKRRLWRTRHHGDCSIYANDICDCGQLRRDYSLDPSNEVLINEWISHERAMDQSSLKARVERLEGALKIVEALIEVSSMKLSEQYVLKKTIGEALGGTK